jgi:hypothetical protein
MENLLQDVIHAKQVQCQKYFSIKEASSGAQEVRSIRLMLQMDRQVVSMNLSFVPPLDSTESLEKWMYTILLASIATMHS